MSEPASAAQFSWLARSLMGSRAEGVPAREWATAHGAPARVVNAIKAAVPAGSSGDATWAGAFTDLNVVFGSFSDSLKNQSVFYRLVSDNAMSRLSIDDRAAIVTIGLTASSVGEGKARAISKLSAANQLLQRRAAICMVVCTRELVKSIGPDGQALLSRELKAATADEVDREFLAIVTAGAPTLTSSGDQLADVQADLKRMLFSVPVRNSSALYWVAGIGAAKGLTAMVDGSGANAFPAAGVLNNELWGYPLLGCSALADDELILLDAHGIAGVSDGFNLSASGQADVELSDTPIGDATTGVGAALTSLFQTNSVGLRCVAYYGAERLRSDSVVKLTSIGWAEAPTA